MIKIIISGILGRMGKEIIKLSHTIDDVSIIAGYDIREEDIGIPLKNTIEELPGDFDVIIDFSSPRATVNMVKFAVQHLKPIIIGTTALGDEDNKKILEASHKIAVLKASNMSVGINVIFAMLKKLPDILYKNFDIEISEIHHSKKKDSPSGTARTMGKIISERKENAHFHYGREGNELKRENGEIGFHSIRGGTVAGIHTVYFLGDDESIEITHRVYSRRIFAIGAIAAAKWIFKKKPGIYSMQDLIVSS